MINPNTNKMLCLGIVLFIITILGLLIADATLNNLFNDHELESDEVHAINVTNITVNGEGNTGTGDVTNTHIVTVQENSKGTVKTSTSTTTPTPKTNKSY